MLLALLAAPVWGAEPKSVWVYASQPTEIIELQGLGLGFTDKTATEYRHYRFCYTP